MFSQFTPMALIRASQYRQSDPGGRRTRPRHRLPDRSRTQARFQLEGLEDRCLLSSVPVITEFPLPSGGTGPYQIVAGSDGNLWFSLDGGGYIGRINPATDAITEFALPTANDTAWAMAAGPDGNVWFTDVNPATETDYIGMINLTTDTIAEYTLHSSELIALRGIVAGPDGNLWFTEASINAIGMINPTTHAITEFALPAGTAPLEITAGSDGNLWFVARGANSIGMINPTTHASQNSPSPPPPPWHSESRRVPTAISGSPR